MAKMNTRFVFFLAVQFATVLSQSNKALKLGFTNTESLVVTSTSSSSSLDSEIENDPFFEDLSSTREDDFLANDPFFDDEDLPPCEVDGDSGLPCQNVTKPVEIRLNDMVMSKLISQVWSDFQRKVNNDAKIGDIVIDPFDVDSRLPKPIDIHQSSNMFNVDVKMNNIKVFGLSGIRLDESSVTRNENLTDLKVLVKFAFDNLNVTGKYDLKGIVGWWELDSNGVQPFSISMVNATLTFQMVAVLASDGQWDERRCDQQSQGNVHISEIRLPLDYADVNFKFNNLGSFANTVVNAVGVYFLKTQEDTLVGEIRKVLKKHVNSLIC